MAEASKALKSLNPYLDLFCDEAGYCLSPPAFSKDPFAIELDPEPFKQPERFVGFQKIFSLFRPSHSERSMFKDVSLEDDLSTFLQSFFDSWNETTFQKIEISDKVVSLFFNLILVKVDENGVNLDSFFSG